MFPLSRTGCPQCGGGARGHVDTTRSAAMIRAQEQQRLPLRSQSTTALVSRRCAQGGAPVAGGLDDVEQQWPGWLGCFFSIASASRTRREDRPSPALHSWRGEPDEAVLHCDRGPRWHGDRRRNAGSCRPAQAQRQQFVVGQPGTRTGAAPQDARRLTPRRRPSRPPAVGSPAARLRLAKRSSLVGRARKIGRRHWIRLLPPARSGWRSAGVGGHPLDVDQHLGQPLHLSEGRVINGRGATSGLAGAATCPSFGSMRSSSRGLVHVGHQGSEIAVVIPSRWQHGSPSACRRARRPPGTDRITVRPMNGILLSRSAKNR